MVQPLLSTECLGLISAYRSTAVGRMAPWVTALLRSTFSKSTLVKFAWVRLAFVKLVPASTVLLRLVRLRLVPDKFAFVRFGTA